MQRIFNFLAELFFSTVGLKPSHLFPSPSKFFLLRKLVVCLDQSAGMSIGLDVACADFKYRDLFKTEQYVGIDLEKENLNKGLALRAHSGDVGIVANLLSLERTPEVTDLLVSTHTIASLPVDDRVRGVQILAKAVRTNGTLFVNMPSEDDTPELENFFLEQFGEVSRTVYGNWMFMKIENFFAYRTGGKGLFSLAMIGISTILCYLFSFFENMQIVRGKGAYTLYWCKKRKSGDSTLQISRLQQLSEPLTITNSCG